LRKTVAALALVLIAALGLAVPSVAAATGDPKVVIIVGATGGATASYRADADVAYTEARKYTPNVIKVYSPNATWAKVKAAVAGASVVIYLGHGNGWPAPYPYDPAYTTKDGFGLNATAGNGDYNVKYYGEPYIATLALAPGALVILNHLCYASGNSEPGNPEPTVTVARQRADNFAAAFLKAGAGAVIADGHAGSEVYLRAVFTTHQSIVDLWRTVPVGNGHIVSFASARTPGAMVYQDPITPTTGFYRSLAVGTLGITTDEIVSAGYGDTGVDPTTLVVPGNASVSSAGAGLFSSLDTTAASLETLPAGTRLRVVDEPVSTTADGVAPQLVQVVGVDDPTITGYVLATDLVPRDSAPPVVRVLDPGPAFSPNGDGVGDVATLRARFTESVSWDLKVKDGGGHGLLDKTGTGSTASVSWDGLVSGHPVPDGAYTVTVTAVDAWGNGPAHSTATVVVDTVAPHLTSVTPGTDPVQWFSPNGDGVRDTVSLAASNSEDGAIVATVLDGSSAVIDSWTVPNGSGATAVTWDGRTSNGAVAPDGMYTFRVAPRDVAGNTGATMDRTVAVVGAMRALTSSSALFFPQDNDTLASATKLSFSLARPMTVTWTVRNAAGAIVATRYSAAALPAGGYGWWFYGRAADGTMLPRGKYTTTISATDGTLTATGSAAITMDAFVIKPNDTTPGRGQTIKVRVTSAEKLGSTPVVHVKQPGYATWTVRLVKTGMYTYTATIRMKTGKPAGSVSLRVTGVDIRGGANSSTKVLRLH
jgi:flagellar hook assembly protein FlgD